MFWSKLGYAAVLALVYVYKSSQIQNDDKKLFLVEEAHYLTKAIFNRGKTGYNDLKEAALDTINTFLDLVKTMNDLMARDLRSAVLKFYKIKYLHDFTNYIMSMEENLRFRYFWVILQAFQPPTFPSYEYWKDELSEAITNITEHCLIEPVEKLVDLRQQFHDIIKNFEDARNFESVNKCYEQQDEVAVAHCILHQGVLFDEMLQGSLVTTVTLKTRQHAQDMNESIYSVQKCLNYFVPKFFDQLMVDVYTDKCQYLRVVNASINDLLKDKSKNVTLFTRKWKPLAELLKTKLKSPGADIDEPLFATLFGSNSSSADSSNLFHH